MKIVRYVLDEILESWIFEMSLERHKLKDKLMDISPKINEHLLYIKLYPNSRDINHWQKEIHGFLKGVATDLVKLGNKKLDAKVYFDCLFKTHLENNFEENIKVLFDYCNKWEGKTEMKFNDIDILDLEKEYKYFYTEISIVCASKIIDTTKIGNLIDNWTNKKLKLK